MRSMLISFFVLIVYGGYTQSILVSEGLDVRTDLSYELLGYISGKYMVASYGNDLMSIHTFNDELFHTSTQDFLLPDKKSRIVHVYPYEDQFSVLFTTLVKDTLILMNRTYNPNFEIAKTDTLVKLQRGYQNFRFRYSFSEDKARMNILVMRGDELVYYLVYDLEYLEMVHKGPLDFSQFSFFEDYRKTVVTNSGIVYVIFEVNNYIGKRDDHAYYIYKIRDADVIDESVLPMKTLLTYDAVFQYDNLNNKLVISGLASEKSTDRAEMIFQVRQDPKESDYFEYSTFVFHNNLLDDFYGNNRKAKVDYLRDVQVQDVILMNDGSSIMIIEEVTKLERMVYGRPVRYGDPRTVDYHYENILLFSLSPAGDSWQKLLPKRQFSNDDDGVYSSYFVFKNLNHLRLIYNDEIRNENTVSEYIIRPNGASLRTNLLSTEFQKLRLQVRNGIQLSDHRVLIPSVRGKILRLLVIDYLDKSVSG